MEIVFHMMNIFKKLKIDYSTYMLMLIAILAGYIKNISIILIICIVFLCFDFVATEITDNFAYEDAVVNETEWTAVYDKILAKEQLSDRDYEVIFEQSGLGQSAVESLIEENRTSDFEYC